MTIDEHLICENALVIYDHLQKDTPGMRTCDSTFKSSSGWFENFRKRTGIHGVIRFALVAIRHGRL